MAEAGYIKLFRQITSWEWYNDINTFRVFVHILLTANYSDGKFSGRVVRRGQLITSTNMLAKQTSLTIQQARTALKHLISTCEITCSGFNKYTVITVLKYDLYQDSNMPANKQLTSNQQTTNKQLTSNQQANQQQYKNNKKEKEEKEEQKEQEESTSAKRFTPPTKDDILNYCLDQGFGIDVDALFDYYSSKGWKVGNSPMKDWRAAVRNWARRDKSFTDRKEPVKLPAQSYEQRDYSGEQDAWADRLMAWAKERGNA